MSDSAIPSTVAHQAPLSLGFSRQEYWNTLFQGNIPDPGIEPESPTLQADSLLLSQQGSPCIYRERERAKYPVEISESSDGGEERLGWDHATQTWTVQEGFRAREQEAVRGGGWVGPILPL